MHFEFVPNQALYNDLSVNGGHWPTINIIVYISKQPAVQVSPEIPIFGQWQTDPSIYVTPAFTAPGVTQGTSYNNMPFYNNSSLNQFVMLRHYRIPIKKYLLQQGQTTSAVGTDSTYKYLMQRFLKKIHLKFAKGLMVEYKANGGLESDLLTNHIFFTLYVDQLNNTSLATDIRYSFEYVIRYQDS